MSGRFSSRTARSSSTDPTTTKTTKPLFSKSAATALVTLSRGVPATTTTSVRAPLAARLAFLLLLLSLYRVKARTEPVLRNARIAALHALFRNIHSCVLESMDLGGGGGRAMRMGLLMEEGNHDCGCSGKASLMAAARASTAALMEVEISSAYLRTWLGVWESCRNGMLERVRLIANCWIRKRGRRIQCPGNTGRRTTCWVVKM